MVDKFPLSYLQDETQKKMAIWYLTSFQEIVGEFIKTTYFYVLRKIKKVL